MSDIVIVAIPAEDDPVWKVSSEKIPHLTMLFMKGPFEDEENTIRFIEHVASTSLSRFGLSVDRRGTLGKDDADVLFFSKTHGFKELLAVRSHLLGNTDIFTAYKNAEQYPVWTPHLTLGYPATPANPNPNDYGINWVNFDRLAVWTGDFDGPEFRLKSDNDMAVDIDGAWSYSELDEHLAHFGVRGMKWGVRKNERALNRKDQALNLHQRSQVRIASGISALATVGITSNAAATLFQLQSRFEHLRILQGIAERAADSPYLTEAGKVALKETKNHVVQGLVYSAAATTAVSTAIGVVTHRTAKAYFAPLHKVYGDSKREINSELRTLSKDIKSGKRPAMSAKEYNAEAAKIVRKHMLKDEPNVLKPFHELARSQLGTEYNTKSLKVEFSKLPNTDLYSKMTVVTPDGLKLVKAVKNVQHAATVDLLQDLDYYFDYKFDSEGFVEEFSCPTIEIANDLLEGRFDMESITSQYGGDQLEQSALLPDLVEDILEHAGERTVGDVYNDMTEEERDLVAILISSEDDESFSDEQLDALYEVYEQMDDEQLAIMNFIVGEARSGNVEHSDSSDLDDILMHFGVRGMKWGVRKSDSSGGGTSSRAKKPPSARKLARQKVYKKQGSLQDAHSAGLKSTGHRIANAFLGDKTYWKRTAVIAGVTAAAVAGLTLAAPATMSAVAVTSFTVGLYTAVSAGSAAGTVNTIDNFVRAVRGNARIRNNYVQLGNSIQNRQSEADRRTKRILSRNGSIPRSKFRENSIAQSEQDSLDDVLMHFGVRGMKWGVRRSVGSNGLVEGTVEGAISRGQKPRAGTTVTTRGSKATGGHPDHQKMVENLNKKVEDLSTAEIRELTNRIQAVSKFAEKSAEQKAAQASAAKKLTKWALGQVRKGVTNAAESYVQEVSGDLTKEILSVLPKTASKKAREEAERKKQEAQKPKKEQTSQEPKTREEAVNDLAKAIQNADGSFSITSKKGG